MWDLLAGLAMKVFAKDIEKQTHHAKRILKAYPKITLTIVAIAVFVYADSEVRSYFLTPSQEKVASASPEIKQPSSGYPIHVVSHNSTFIGNGIAVGCGVDMDSNGDHFINNGKDFSCPQ